MKNRRFYAANYAATLILVACCSLSVTAQRNFYHRLDIGSSNVYSFVGSNLITGYANYLTHDILFDNSYTYTFLNANYEGQDIKTKTYNPMGLTASDVFNDAFAGIKLGYQSDYVGSFNWGLYVSTHYKINQFKAQFPFAEDYSKECVQYVKPGMGVLLTFGNVESQTKVQVEAALRYDIPIKYKGIFGDNTDELNKGLSTHLAVKVAGYSWLSVGAYVDLNHYDLYNKFDELEGDSKFKMYSAGITFTITPKRGEDIYD